MIALLGVEIRRALARRMLLTLIVLALAGVAVGGAVTFVKSHAPTPEALKQAQAQADSDLKHCLAGEYIREEDLPPETTLEEWCNENAAAASYVPSSALYLSDLGKRLQSVSFLLVAGAVAFGASVVGAEWNAGTMTTLLTWEPRRLRVLAAKMVAVVAVTFAMAIGLQLVLSLVLTLVAAVRGSTAGAGGAWLRSVVGSSLRIAGASSVAGLIGLAVAMIGRNGSAALGGIFVYVAVIEGILRGISVKFGLWLLGDNVSVFIIGRPRTYSDQTVTAVSGGGQSIVYSQPQVRTVGQAAVIVGLYALTLMLAAAWSFSARDVN